MNAKLKIALLAILGLSSAACCSTKKAKKSDDAKSAGVEDKMEDPRVMLMYGVPFPDGEIARPVEEDKGVEADDQGVPFHDGSVAHPLTEEAEQELRKAIEAEEAAKRAAEAEQKAE